VWVIRGGGRKRLKKARHLKSSCHLHKGKEGKGGKDVEIIALLM